MPALLPSLRGASAVQVPQAQVMVVSTAASCLSSLLGCGSSSEGLTASLARARLALTVTLSSVHHSDP